jgi:hypothetical protein
MVPVELQRYLFQELKKMNAYGIFRELIPHSALTFSLEAHYSLDNMLHYFLLVAQLRSHQGNYIKFYETFKAIQSKAENEDKEYLDNIQATYIYETFKRMKKMTTCRKEMKEFLSVLERNGLTIEKFIAKQKKMDMSLICGEPLYRLCGKGDKCWLLEFRVAYKKTLNKIIHERKNYI